MPELPEVETIVRDLAPELEGRTIVGVDLCSERSLGGIPVDDLVGRVIGHRIASVQRRAKYILLRMDSGEWLAVHLAMTGNLVIRGNPDDDDRYLRCAFRLDDGRWLLFRDMRRFGRLRVLSPQERQSLDDRLGPEPLDPQLAPTELRQRLEKRRSPIKAVLLDQGFLAGLGNIYADETLFMAQIHPLRPANSLSPSEVERLYSAIRAVLQQAIWGRGTSFSDYRDGYGRKGGHQEALQVYRRTGSACPRCGAPIQRLVVGGRGTHFCPQCQRAHTE